MAIRAIALALIGRRREAAMRNGQIT